MKTLDNIKGLAKFTISDAILSLVSKSPTVPTGEGIAALLMR